jgi:meiotic recombination protein SPO11
MDEMLMTDDPVTALEVNVTAANRQVLNYIETTFNGILNEISNPSGEGRATIRLNRIVSIKPYYDNKDFAHLKWHVESREVAYCFPGRNKDEAWRFGKKQARSCAVHFTFDVFSACVGRILGEIYAAIKQGVTITKRDIYYHDPALFRSQETVDRYLDDIAHTCRVTRRDLNVVSTPRL